MGPKSERRAFLSPFVRTLIYVSIIISGTEGRCMPLSDPRGRHSY